MSKSGALATALALLTAAAAVRAQESTHGDQPAPSSVEDLEVRFGGELERFARGTPLFPWYREWTKDSSPFLRDAELSVRLRSYYLDRQNLDNSDSIAWANGGSVYYKSGQAFDLLSAEAEYFSSIRTVGDEDEDGTLLLKPRQHSFGVLGQLNGQIDFGDVQVKAYRQRIDLPYVNVRDNRMVPNTFEAYLARGAVGDFEFGAGYIAKIKRRDSDEFISMSEQIGAEGDRGMLTSGLRYRYAPGSSVGAINHYVDDVINVFYTEASHLFGQGEDLQLRVEAQLTDQRSVGDQRLTGEHFQTFVTGARVAASYGGVIVKAAFSTTGKDQRIRSPWGTYPGYLSLIRRNFNRAGEDAWLVGASYDFSGLGLEGLSSFVNYAQGRNAYDSDGLRAPNRNELDVTVDYRVPGELFEGLWIRLRAAFLEESGGGNSADYRVIVNYEVPIF